MILYATTASLLLLCHLIYHRGKNGCALSIRLEKLVVFIATIMSIVAIIKLCSFAASLFVRQGNELSGWDPSMLVYAAGFIVFLLVIFVALPKPIEKKQQA